MILRTLMSCVVSLPLFFLQQLSDAHIMAFFLAWRLFSPAAPLLLPLLVYATAYTLCNEYH